MQEPPAAPTNPAAPKPAAAPRGHALSAVELGAQRGIGPLSPLGLKSWHGDAYPCVSCGQLVRRSAIVCDQCGQDLSLKMIVKMQAYSGPWYVHEHVRPFPGVTLERLVRQVQRGVLTATTIVRGPTTYHQWRFAAETPALSKHLGLCWNCQARVTPADVRCGGCGVDLDNPPGESCIGETVAQTAPPPPPAPTAQRAAAPRIHESPPPPANAADFERIRAALSSTPAGGAAARRGLPVVPIIGAILVVAIVILFLVVRIRGNAQLKAPPASPAATTAVVPSSNTATTPGATAAPSGPAPATPPDE